LAVLIAACRYIMMRLGDPKLMEHVKDPILRPVDRFLARAGSRSAYTTGRGSITGAFALFPYRGRGRNDRRSISADPKFHLSKSANGAVKSRENPPGARQRIRGVQRTFATDQPAWGQDLVIEGFGLTRLGRAQ
jgi:hypothetical protein